MTNLIIIGAGGHANTVYEIAQESKKFSEINFLDDAFDTELMKHKKMRKKIIGKIERFSCNSIMDFYEYSFVAIGNNSLRSKLLNNLKKSGYKIPALKHPSAIISNTAEICEGVLIAANSVVQSFSKIGAGTILNTSCTVDHDSIVGECVHICPGVNIAGEVVIGDNTFIGIGSKVINQIKIGNNVFIPAGELVKNDISSHNKLDRQNLNK